MVIATIVPDFFISGFPAFWIARKAEICNSRFVSAAGRGRSTGKICPMASRQADDQFHDDATEADGTKSLNFKVDAEFKKEFKGFAVAQGISMTDLLREGFALSKKKRQK